MLSLNEIEAETRKAVRGAGLPWGIAEEGGKAARWLAGQGIDATVALADILDRHANGSLGIAIARGADGRWIAPRGALCPLTLGATICDHAFLLAEGTPLAAGAVARPLLLLPFAARAARIAGRPISLLAGRQQVNFSRSGETARPPVFADIAEAAAVTCEIFPSDIVALPREGGGRPNLDPVSWRTIGTYAFRTYVPASEHSRRHGAGAGMIDND